MKTLTAIAVAVLMSAPFAVAQKLTFSFDSLAAKAKEKAEVDLDGATLGLAAKADKKIGELASGLKELHVRHYEFGQAGAYTAQDLEPLHKQLGPGSGWSHIVNVKEKDEHVEVLAHVADGKPAGFLVIAAEAKELSLIYILGEISLDKLSELVKSDIKYDMKGLMAQKAAEDAQQAPKPAE